MFATIRQLFRSRHPARSAEIPAGERIYAIGDIHGCIDLFSELLAAIEQDDAARAAADTTIILLGDLVDRGPDSAGVLAAARMLGARRKLHILAGNHEEIFLDSFDDDETMRQFLRFGGWETILSYGVDQRALTAASLAEARELMRAAVPAADLDFIRSFKDTLVIGGYLFVHAGIRPGIPIEQQKLEDLHWIRKPFLNAKGDHGYMVVHGHSITEAPDMRTNRIGIDTGAYMSGRLTALGLEGTQRWLIETSGASAMAGQKKMPGGL